jgi:hypothetical protein
MQGMVEGHGRRLSTAEVVSRRPCPSTPGPFGPGGPPPRAGEDF